jgi:hypothetical protein
MLMLEPAWAVETSSIISQNTGDINSDQASILEDNQKISDINDQINYHSNIIKDIINGMNNVKWYQFWKWNFYINEGPQRIQDESKTIETLSYQVKQKATDVSQKAQNINETGNKSLELSLEVASKTTQTNTINNYYNTGNAKENVDLIADHLSSRFQTKYTAVSADTFNNGDIIQYPLTHSNYVYLQYVGMNPKGDKALFLGDSNTAIRLPVAALKNIQYKIVPKTTASTTNSSNSTPSGKKIINTVQNSFTSQLTSYVATLQKNGLENYNKSGVIDLDSQINDSNETKNMGSNIMIAGGVIGGVAIGLTIIMYFLTDLSVVIGGMGAIFPPLFACEIPIVSTYVAIAWLVAELGVISGALLCIGGGIYVTADSKIDDLNEDKNTFINGCNAVDNDLKSYNSGAVNILPISNGLFVDGEQNTNTYGVLNATDVDNDGLIYSAVGNPSHGKIKVNTNGRYLYTPDQGYHGNDSFTYIANDGYGNSNVATVNIMVHPFNYPPVSTDMVFDIETNTTLSAQLKAIDQDGDPVTYILLNSSSRGNITINSDGTFTYTPLDGFIGNDTFTYVAKDWKEKGNIATVHVNVHSINHLPVTEDMNLRVAKNENITCKLLATDADGDNLLFKLIGKPSKGTINLNSDGTFTYIPKKNFVGKDLFTFKANDWQGESGLRTVNIEVYEFNHPPVANNMAINMVKNKIFLGLFNATDMDDDKLTYQIVNNPKHGTMKISLGKFVYTPSNGFVGHDSFTYRAYDGKNQSNIATVKITVSNIIPKSRSIKPYLKIKTF